MSKKQLFRARNEFIPESASSLARQKILSLDELALFVGVARNRGRSIALAHGTFDLVHMGHVRHLEQARQLGDVLIVTITADQFINKGPGRPVFTAPLRAEMVAALACVDRVAVNDAPTAENILHLIKPDVYVKGSDYAPDEKGLAGKVREERDAVVANGGRIHFTDDITFSSSSLLNRHFDVFEPELRAYLDRTRQNAGRDDFAEIHDAIKDK
jgi:rfaE bifunctional protein nucleotidyltransferase chain/domain